MSSSQRDSSPSPASGRWRVDLEAEARPKALFICGSVNQTRQLHAISRALPEVAAYFSPYYADGLVERLRRLGLCDHTILGWPWRKKAMRYLRQHGLSLDHEGRRHGPQYELVATCSDVLMPENIRGKKTVLVQEGITRGVRGLLPGSCDVGYIAYLIRHLDASRLAAFLSASRLSLLYADDTTAGMWRAGPSFSLTLGLT